MTGTSLINRMADKRHLDPQTFYQTIKTTLMPSNTTAEQLAAFLMVADRYGLDPLTREIYAFPNRRGTGITPVVSIDGWINLVNSHPQCDGFTFDYVRSDEGKLVGVTCTIHRKDRTKPTVVTEFLSENYRNTEPWNQMPARMLRHKALKECARYAFGFAGITDEDEAREIDRSADPVHGKPQWVDDGIMKALNQFASSGTATPDDVAPAGPPSTDPATQTAGASPPPNPEAPAVDLRGEAIDKLLALATDKELSLEERLEEIDLKRTMWMEALADRPQFATALLDTVAKVARGELKVTAARKFLEALP